MNKAQGARRKAQGSPRASREAEPFRHTPYALLLICALATPPALGASAQTDVSNVGRGSPAQYVKVTGRGFAGQVRGEHLQVRVEEIRLESTGKLVPVRYSALGVAVYQREKMLGVKWDFDIGGELTAARPSATLTGRPFTVPWLGQKCEQGGCEVRLQLKVETGSTAHAEHTDLAAMPVTVARAPEPARPWPRAAAKPGAKPGAKPDSQPGVQPGAKPPAGGKAVPTPVPRGQAPEARRAVDKEIDLAITAFEKGRRAEAEKLLEDTLAIAIQGRKVDARHPLAAQLLFHASYNYEREKAPRKQELALLWSLVIVEGLPPADVRKAIGSQRFDKEIVARRLADFYWNARRYDRAFEYYDRAYRHVADLGLQEPTRNVLLAFNSAGRMATACHLGKWDIADAAMRELKDRAARVDASTRTQLDYWIRTGEPRLAARKC